MKKTQDKRLYINKVVESEARRQLSTLGHLDHTQLKDVLETECKHWGINSSNASLSIQGKTSIPRLRYTFLSILVSLLSAIVTLAVTLYYFHPTIWQYIAFPLLVMVLIYTTLQPFISRRRQRAIENIISSIRVSIP